MDPYYTGTSWSHSPRRDTSPESLCGTRRTTKSVFRGARTLRPFRTSSACVADARRAERGRLHVNQTEVNTECRLDKGTHRSVHATLPSDTNAQCSVCSFPWSMRLPRHTLPYERAPCGKVTNHLEAIAPGLGLMGKPLQATTRIKVVASPSMCVQQLYETALSSTAASSE